MTHSFPTRRSSDLNPIYRKLYFKLSEKVIYFCHARARPCGRGLVAEPGKLALGVAFRRRLAVGDRCTAVALPRKPGGDLGHADRPPDRPRGGQVRPEETRRGQECVRPCSSRGWAT